MSNKVKELAAEETKAPKTIKVWTLVKVITILVVIVAAFVGGIVYQSNYQTTHQAEINKEASKLIKSLK